MKKFLSMTILILAFVFFLPYQQANASSNSDDARKAFKDYLDENREKGFSFFITDMNKDGIPEMITSEMYGTLYAYVGGEIVYLDSGSGSRTMRGYSVSQRIWEQETLYTETGEVITRCYKFNGKELVQVKNVMIKDCVSAWDIGYDNSTKNINNYLLTGISSKSAILAKGKTKNLNVYGTTKTIKWTSSNESTATVNSKGKVTAKKSGEATITAKVGKKLYTCKIIIPDSVKLCEIISIDKNKLKLKYTSLMCDETSGTYYYKNDGITRTLNLTEATQYCIYDYELYEWTKMSKEKLENIDKENRAFTIYILNKKVIRIQEYVYQLLFG